MRRRHWVTSLRAMVHRSNPPSRGRQRRRNPRHLSRRHLRQLRRVKSHSRKLRKLPQIDRHQFPRLLRSVRPTSQLLKTPAPANSTPSHLLPKSRSLLQPPKLPRLPPLAEARIRRSLQLRKSQLRSPLHPPQRSQPALEPRRKTTRRRQRSIPPRNHNQGLQLALCVFQPL